MSLSPLNGAPPSQVQVIVFDFGGVVGKADRTQITTFVMTSCGIDEEELKRAMVDMKVYRKQVGSEKEFWQQYALAKGKVLPADWPGQFDDVVKRSIYEIPGTVALIKTLKKNGYETALLSNTTEEKANVLRQLGYYKLFNPVLLSYEIGAEKPSPKAYEILLQAIHHPINAIVFIDDKIRNIEGAKAQGIDSILFVNAEQLAEELRKRGVDLSTDDQKTGD